MRIFPHPFLLSTCTNQWIRFNIHLYVSLYSYGFKSQQKASIMLTYGRSTMKKKLVPRYAEQFKVLKVWINITFIYVDRMIFSFISTVQIKNSTQYFYLWNRGTCILDNCICAMRKRRGPVVYRRTHDPAVAGSNTTRGKTLSWPSHTRCANIG